jgi:methoxymalonate biosynthesis acyl carrier protein
MDKIKKTIRSFITPLLKGYKLDDNQDIFELDIIDSLFAMQLVLLVEKEFAVNFEKDDLDFQNFRSIDSITELVVRKTDKLSHKKMTNLRIS